jgi:hypothetical protein
MRPCRRGERDAAGWEAKEIRCRGWVRGGEGIECRWIRWAGPF